MFISDVFSYLCYPECSSTRRFASPSHPCWTIGVRNATIACGGTLGSIVQVAAVAVAADEEVVVAVAAAVAAAPTMSPSVAAVAATAAPRRTDELPQRPAAATDQRPGLQQQQEQQQLLQKPSAPLLAHAVALPSRGHYSSPSSWFMTACVSSLFQPLGWPLVEHVCRQVKTLRPALVSRPPVLCNPQGHIGPPKKTILGSKLCGPRKQAGAQRRG